MHALPQARGLNLKIESGLNPEFELAAELRRLPSCPLLHGARLGSHVRNTHAQLGYACAAGLRATRDQPALWDLLRWRRRLHLEIPQPSNRALRAPGGLPGRFAVWWPCAQHDHPRAMCSAREADLVPPMVAAAAVLRCCHLLHGRGVGLRGAVGLYRLVHRLGCTLVCALRWPVWASWLVARGTDRVA